LFTVTADSPRRQFVLIQRALSKDRLLSGNGVLIYKYNILVIMFTADI